MSVTNHAIQQERRRLLIDATITAIAEYGLSKLTLAKISSVAGLTAGTVNFHFDSKESLLLETLNFVSEEFDQSIAQALRESGSDPSKRLAAIIEASLDPEITEHRKMAVWYAFDSESQSREDYKQICGQRDRDNFKLILSLCDQIIRKGGMQKKSDARAIANAIGGLTDEMWKEILFAGESYDRGDAKHVCMSFLASVFPWCYEMPAENKRGSASEPRATTKVVRAGKPELEQAARLFDLYRQFYQQQADPKIAKSYLGARLKTDSSIVYLAYLGDSKKPVGFMQIYESFCSVAAKPILVLYDLYVESDARNNGVGKALMTQALKLAKESRASRIDLETAVDNHKAQALYESLGYERDTEFYKYSLEL